jgi:hypothetical protein
MRAGVDLKPCWVMTGGDHNASRLPPGGIVAAAWLFRQTGLALQAPGIGISGGRYFRR